MITTLTRADGYVMIDLNKEGLKKGEGVMVQLF
jgi:molybdopterin biosynthesis enzyme